MHSTARLVRATTLALLVSIVPAAVAAQTQDVEALIREGVRQRRDGHDEEALATLTRAWELGHTPRGRAQMGFAEQALGRWQLAEAHMLEARQAESDAWIHGHRDVIDRALATVGQHLATLMVAGGPPGAEVLIEGHVVGTMPLARPLRVGSGVVALEVRAPGFVTMRRSVELAPGATGRESIDLAPAEAVAPPTPAVAAATPMVAVQAPVQARPPRQEPITPPRVDAPPTPGMAPLRVVGLVGAGAGVVLAAVGIGLYVDVDSQFQACLLSGCAPADQPTGQDTASVALMWTGGALALGGAVVALLAPPSRPRREVAAASPWFDPRGLVGVRGSF